jgi:hypothetical protein
MHNFFILKQYVCYIIILDMFGALTGPSSGGQNVLSQHLVSSLSVNGCTVCRLREDCRAVMYSRLQRVTIPDAVIIQFVLLKKGMLMLETCRGL